MAPRTRTYRPLRLLVASAALALVAAAAVGTCTGQPPRPAESPRAAAALQPEDLDEQGVVVDFRDGTTKETFDRVEKGWGIDLEFNSAEGPRTGITIGRIDAARRDSLLASIRKDANVEFAEPLYRYRASFVPNDPEWKAQWNFEMIELPKAWDRSRGAGVVVAVIDTGIAYEDHDAFRRLPDLAKTRFVAGYDFVNDDEHANDDNGHGSHVAGTIAQSTDNGIGVAGIAFEAKLMPVKVLDAFGSGSSADIADAIRFAADHGAKVLNLSLGGGGPSEVLEAAVGYARRKGAVVVCAAGNGARGVVEYPAAYPGSLAVSAVGPTGELASYSSWGEHLDLAAPGGDKRRREQDGVLQNTVGRQSGESVYAWYQGTSMATPHVAGVAALLFAAGAASPEEVERALYAGADKSRGAAWNDHYGHGVLNARGALVALDALPGRPLGQRVIILVLGVLLGLLVFVSLPERLRRRVRPSVALAGSLAVTVLGLFFLPWLGLRRIPGVATLSQPLPDWGAVAAAANPVFCSALIPVLLALFGFRQRRLRGALAGIALGFAAILLARLLGAQLDLFLLPWRLLAAAWLLVNALLALLVARAALHHDAEGSP